RPLSAEDVLTGRVVGPDAVAGVPVETDQARSARVGNPPLCHVGAVPGNHIDEFLVTGDGTATDESSVRSARKNPELGGHIDLPGHCRVPVAATEWANIQTDYICAIGNEPDPVLINQRRRGHAGQLAMLPFPEQRRRSVAIERLAVAL